MDSCTSSSKAILLSIVAGFYILVGCCLCCSSQEKEYIYIPPVVVVWCVEGEGDKERLRPNLFSPIITIECLYSGGGMDQQKIM
jgi:hypothetical protein